MPFYPSEIMPLFLYLGDHRHAYNASLNHDLKIHTHVRLGNERELPPALPESTEELHVDVEDTPQSDLGSHFSKIVEFIGKNVRHQSRKYCMHYNTWLIVIYILHNVCRGSS